MNEQEYREFMLQAFENDYSLGEYQIRLNLGEVNDEKAYVIPMDIIIEALGWDECLRIMRNVKTGKGAIHFVNPFIAVSQLFGRKKTGVILEEVFRLLSKVSQDKQTDLLYMDISCDELKQQLSEDEIQTVVWEMARWRIVDREEKIDEAMLSGYCFHSDNQKLRIFIEEKRMLPLWKTLKHEYERFNEWIHVEIPQSLKEIEEHPEKLILHEEALKELLTKSKASDN